MCSLKTEQISLIDNIMHSNSTHLNSYLLLSTLGHLIPAPMGFSLSLILSPFKNPWNALAQNLFTCCIIWSLLLITDCPNWLLLICCKWLEFQFNSRTAYSHSHHHHHYCCCTKLHCPTRGVNRQWDGGRPSASIVRRSVTQPQQHSTSTRRKWNLNTLVVGSFTS